MVHHKDHRVQLQLDPTIATPFPSVDSTPEDTQLLTALASFLKEDMVTQLVSDLTLGD